VIRRLLVANRGEIAVRVIRAAHDLGLEAVAVAATSDTAAPHVSYADDVVQVEARHPRAAYLDVDALIEAGRRSGCDAVHPGYGFLSESAAFARGCEAAGLTFVGPPADVIELAGNKVAARETAVRAGAPVVPGSGGAIALESAAEIAETIGYPVLCKAAFGGGGRGIRVLNDQSSLVAALNSAAEEARISFGDGALYLERYLPRVRHIEVQVLADCHGNLVHLGERECSIQRRHQKLLEESPAVCLSDTQRQELGEAAVAVARACGYVNAGTIEFVYDIDDEKFYFIEINARIQVEHPVTEMVTGVDLVVEQLRVADGLPLALAQEDVELRGHAIECRITAEDVSAGFMPSPGTVSKYRVPGGPGLRVDGFLETGSTVSPHYDSLIAKVIAHGKDRAAALARMRRGLREFQIDGIATTVPFHRDLLDDPEFIKGDITTRFRES
jgi:acetyl-CoA carboxylase biotin carboxylase subunit